MYLFYITGSKFNFQGGRHQSKRLARTIPPLDDQNLPVALQVGGRTNGSAIWTSIAMA